MGHPLSETQINELRSNFERQLAGVKNKADLEMLNRDWLSKDGAVKSLFKHLKDVSPEEKPSVAARLNQLKEQVEGALAVRGSELDSGELEAELATQFIDLSLPASNSGVGNFHPVTRVERRISEVLRGFGFENVLGPEVEDEYYCFDSLNIPKHHPARDLQDTFYTDSSHVLRTHTTSIQARVLQERGKLADKKLPIKIASFGRTYRNETEDASHQSMFHQFELVWVEPGLTLSNLHGIITHILKELYGKRRKIRFVPKYYPYTEPSIGPQIDCTICKTEGCPACGYAGWVTVGGAGMIHRKVLREFNFDPEIVSGFAFGLGTSRLASQMFNVPKLKVLYDNDLRVLKDLA